jgi:hypothetical protein
MLKKCFKIKFVIHVVPEMPSDESRKSKVNPKRQKLAELAATLKSSDKRGVRARKRKERENTSSKKEKKRKKRKSVDGDLDDGSSHGNRSVTFFMPNDTCQIQYACKPVWSCDFRSCSRTVVI